MSNDKVDPSNKDPKISSADDLTKTKKGNAELSEEELKRVSGGTKYLQYNLTDAQISSYSVGSGGDKP